MVDNATRLAYLLGHTLEEKCRVLPQPLDGGGRGLWSACVTNECLPQLEEEMEVEQVGL